MFSNLPRPTSKTLSSNFLKYCSTKEQDHQKNAKHQKASYMKTLVALRSGAQKTFVKFNATVQKVETTQLGKCLISCYRSTIREQMKQVEIDALTDTFELIHSIELENDRFDLEVFTTILHSSVVPGLTRKGISTVLLDHFADTLLLPYATHLSTLLITHISSRALKQESIPLITAFIVAFLKTLIDFQDNEPFMGMLYSLDDGLNAAEAEIEARKLQQQQRVKETESMSDSDDDDDEDGAIPLEHPNVLDYVQL